MRHHKQSYKSLVDYDLDRVLQQRRNLAQVESVLTLYQKNNQNLAYQVYDLIRQNQILRKQANITSPAKSKASSFKHKYTISQAKQSPNAVYAEKSTIKKHPITGNSMVRMDHPRNVYLAPQQAQIVHRKLLKEAKTAHKAYDKSRQYEQFKQKLSEKKEQLRKSYRTKSNVENPDLTLSRNVYIQQPSLETHLRRPLKSLKKENPNVTWLDASQSQKKQKMQTSPYDNFKKEMVYRSPIKGTTAINEPSKSAQRSPSAIKIQEIYPENSIRIAEPKTKWGDLSSTYFEKSKYQQKENDFIASKQFYETSHSKGSNQKRKKFLNVVSHSVLQQKLNLNK